MANTHEDIWNYLAFLRILKFLNLGNIKFIKKIWLFKYEFFLSLETNFFLNNLILLYEKLFSKFAFRLNNIIFDSLVFLKKFIKISLKIFSFRHCTNII